MSSSGRSSCRPPRRTRSPGAGSRGTPGTPRTSMPTTSPSARPRARSAPTVSWPRGSTPGSRRRARGDTTAITTRTRRCMSVFKDGVASNTHFLNVLPDGASPPAVERIPLYEVYMRMAEELAKRAAAGGDRRDGPGARERPRDRIQRQCARPAEQVRLGGARELRVHSFGDERARQGAGERPGQGRLRERLAVRDVREADHQLGRDPRVLPQGVSRPVRYRGAAAGRGRARPIRPLVAGLAVEGTTVQR